MKGVSTAARDSATGCVLPKIQHTPAEVLKDDVDFSSVGMVITRESVSS